MTKKIPKVSICVVTYNHEKYIKQTLQSIIDQEVDFEIEIVIGDDCSSDSTRGIIDQFYQQYPETIVRIFHDRNLGAVGNYFATHSVAKGEYIAHLDGDDYFLPGKLKSQVDFLDSNERCNISWHRVKYLYDNKVFVDDLIDFEKIKGGFSRADLIKFPFIANHSTKMYRSKMRAFSPPKERTMDYFLNIAHVGDGVAAYVGNEVYGVYRMGVGVSSNPNLVFREYLIDGLIELASERSSDRVAANLASLALVLADLKHRNRTLFKSMALWFKTLSLMSILEYPKYLRFRKNFRAPTL